MSVLEVGGLTTRVGLGGQVVPSEIFQSAVAVPQLAVKLPFSETCLFPVDPLTKLDETRVVYPFNFDGDNPEEVAVLNQECLTAMLTSLKNRNRLKNQVLLVESTVPVPGFRELASEILFEQCDVDRLLPQRAAALSLFALARTSGVVVDCGFFNSSCVAVHEVQLLLDSLKVASGGRQLEASFYKHLQRHQVSDIRPLFAVKLLESEVSKVLPVQSPFVEDSYQKFAVAWTVRRLMAGGPLCDGAMDVESALVARLCTPDGMKIEGLRDSFSPVKRLVGNTASPAVAAMVAESLSCESVHGKLDIVNSVVLAGGLCARLPGFKEALRTELIDQQARNPVDPFAGLPPSLDHMGWRLLSSTRQEERESVAWTGGSIVASLEVFKTVAATKGQYDEFGSNNVWQRIGI